MANKQGTSRNDTLSGTAQDDQLVGLAGNDVLKGLAGNDKLSGGAGNDRLEGGAGNDYLDGGTGDDDLRGGTGNDIYIVDHAKDITPTLVDAGFDTVGSVITYTLGPQQENLTLLDKKAINGSGNAGGNLLTGNDGVNILSGLGGNDVLDGGKGVDNLRGGAGDDIYLVDSAREIDATRLDPGNDQVQSLVNFTLGLHQESLILLNTARALTGTGNAGDNFIRGNDAANVLHGGGGNDRLEGGKGVDNLFGDAGDDLLFGDAGIDHLHGGAGNDSYFLDDAAEIDLAEADAGIDVVNVNFNYTLGAQQEKLSLYRIVGQENALLVGTGNAGDNFLAGTLFGNDELHGGDGDDILNGGAGDDHLLGEGGNDTYFLDHEGDIDRADLDPGRDRVNSTTDYVLGDQQEELVLLGSEGRNGTGNGGANFLVGNSGNNILQGLGGDDEIIGGGGVDSLRGGAGNDILHFEAGAAVIDGGGGPGDDGVDTLFLAGLNANTTLDLTVLDNTLIQGIENIRFAPDSQPGSFQHTHTLVLNIGDLLALSSTTDVLAVEGETGDAVQLAGGGWTAIAAGDNSPGTPVEQPGFDRYVNGAGALYVDHDITVTIV